MLERRERQDLEHSVNIRRVLALILLVLNGVIGYYIVVAISVGRVKIT
jgi:heme A synthase